jgi:hypothetical protein
MIDRLELKTNRYGHFIETRGKRIPRGVSQLLEEDEDLIELKRSDLNPLYRQSITHTVLASNGKPYDDPVKFYVFVDPRFNRQMNDRYKIVLNPNKTAIGELTDFLFRNFQHMQDRDEIFLNDFTIGRIDFNVDITTHTVQELFRAIFFDTKARKHTAIYSDSLTDNSQTVRTIGTKELETFYVGKGMYLLRVYDKVKEAKHRIAILKGQDLEIPKWLETLAAQPLVTRIEIQIRDLYRSGVKKVDTRTGELNIFDPQREHQKVRTFWDLLNVKENQFDVFDELKFKEEKFLTLATQKKRRTAKQDFLRNDWVVNAFNSHIQTIGLDNALKQLPSDTRRDLKRNLVTKSFEHNLNQICYKEIKQWLQN